MNRNRVLHHRTIHKIMAAALTGLIVFQSSVMPVFAENAEQGKEETVYARTDAYGNITEVIVSDWLKNPQKDGEIEDTSVLENIENVKGEESFTQNGEELVWNAGGNDIYYQGTTSKELPVSVQVSYELNGQEISPEKLKGESGHLKIVYQYENRSRQGAVYTPFAMITGMVLSSENFRNVTVSNGKVISDGEKEIIIGFGMPGLSESLRIKETEFLKDVNIPDCFMMEADVTDFNVPLAMTLVSPLNLKELELGDLDSADDITKMIQEFADASMQLVDGSGNLAEGIRTLKDSCAELIEGMDAVDKNMGTLSRGIRTLNSRKKDLTDGIQEIVNGITTLENRKGELISGSQALINGSGSLAEGAVQIEQGLSALAEGEESRQLLTGSGQMAAGSLELSEKIEAYTEGVDSLASQLPEYVRGTDSFIQQTGAYTKGVSSYVTQVNQVLSRLSSEAGQQSTGQCTTSVEKRNVIDASAIENLQSVLTMLQEVQGIANGASKEDLIQLYASYEYYLGELNQCILLLEGSLENIQEETFETVLPEYIPQSGSENTDQQLQVLMQTGNSLSQNGQGLSAGGQTLQKYTDVLLGGAQALMGEQEVTMGQQLTAGAKTLADGAGQVDAGIQRLFANGIVPLEQGAKNLSSGSWSLFMGTQSLNYGLGVFNSGIGRLAEGSGALKSGAVELGEGVQQLAEGSRQLKQGTSRLAQGGNDLEEGVDQLYEGSRKLKEGMEEFDEQGVGKITEFYDEDIQKLVDRLLDLKEAGEAYTLFSDPSYTGNGNVKFIIETGE